MERPEALKKPLPIRLIFRIAAAAAAWVLIAALPRVVRADEPEVAASMTRECEGLLDQLLGPGKAKVLIRVEGEQFETRRESESLIPTPSTATSSAVALPGFIYHYLERTYEPPPSSPMHRDAEQSTHSFLVRKIDAAVVLDSRLTDAQVAAVRSILSDLLAIDSTRGDRLFVTKAPFQPLWRSALQSAEGYRAMLLAGGFGASLLLSSLMACLAFLIGMWMLRGAVARRGSASAEEPAPTAQKPLLAPAPSPVTMMEPAMIEGIPRLGSPFLLGQRFSFLEGRGPEEIAQLVASELPEDLALLFGYLGASNPAQAGLVFAQLPRELQLQVSQAMLVLTSADPDRLTALENRLSAQAELMVRGSDRLAAIFSRMPSDQREDLLRDLKSVDPDVVARLSKSAARSEGT